MREILFRGKIKRTGEWIYGFYGENFGTGDAQISPKKDCCFKIVIPETVSEFSSLYDKNGKKIFEGDVVQFEDNNYVVRRECDTPGGYWAETGYILDHIGWNDYIRFTDTIDEYNNEICVEVIGNIHDNPELLRKEDEGK